MLWCMSEPLTWETKKHTSQIRQTARCKCGSVQSRLIEQTVTRTFRSDHIGAVGRSVKRVGEVEVVCACGRRLSWVDVKGSYRADKKCDGRCLCSKGPVCECSCGGLNHGAGYGA